MKAFLYALNDKSVVVRKAFSEGLAAVTVLGGEKQLQLVVDALISTYNNSENDEVPHNFFFSSCFCFVLKIA